MEPALPVPIRAMAIRALPLGLCVLGVLLRLYGLGDPSLWYDEAASLYLGDHADSVAALLEPAYTVEPPLNTVLTAGWAALVDGLFPLAVTDPHHDFLLRLLPFLFSVLTLPVVYFLARRLFRDERSACLALFFFAIAPFQIYYAQELRVYSVVVLFALLALWFMVEALEEGRLIAWVGLVAALTLLMYAHFITMWYIFALNLAFVLLLPRYKHRFWSWTAANAVLMLLIAPMLQRAFAMHAEVQDIVYPWYPNPTWKTVLITFKNFFAGYGPKAWAYWPLFILAVGLNAAAWKAWRTDRTALTLLTALVWVPVIGCALHWGLSDFSFYEHRLFIVSGAAAILLAARGAALMGRRGLVPAAALAVFTIPCLADGYAGRLHPIPMHRLAMWEKVDFRSVAAHLERNAAPGDRLLYASHFSAYPMMHYYAGDQTRVGWSEADEEESIKTMGHEAILRSHSLMPVPKEEAVADAERIWLLRTEGTSFEWQPTTDRISGWLDTDFEIQEILRWKGVVLTLYTHRFRS